MGEAVFKGSIEPYLCTKLRWMKGHAQLLVLPVAMGKRFRSTLRSDLSSLLFGNYQGSIANGLLLLPLSHDPDLDGQNDRSWGYGIVS